MIWIVALHVSFMVVWFSGLFYLPRLFVYHAMCEDEPGKERFKVMERKLYIMTHIGLAGTVLFASILLVGYAWAAFSGSGWFWVKMFFAAVLIVFHFYCGKMLKDFRDGVNIRGHKFYRVVNEIPVIPMFVMIIMVVVKPF